MPPTPPDEPVPPVRPLPVVLVADGDVVQVTVVDLDPERRRALVGLRGGRVWMRIEGGARLRRGGRYRVRVAASAGRLSLRLLRPPAPPSGDVDLRV